MAETLKAFARRARENFFSLYCVGQGIDIGVGRYNSHGEDKITPTAVGWDLDDGDATYMAGVADESFDFVYSSHCLEHVMNPYLAVKNWWRILKPGGHLLLYVPHRDLYEKNDALPSRWNFDHKVYFLPDREELPYTLNLSQLLRDALGPEAEIIYVRAQDEGHTITDPLVHSDGEYSIEAVIRKPHLS